MEWRRTTVYDGASRWHAEPVIEVEVDAGRLAGWSLATDRPAAGRLTAWRAALVSRPHECRFDAQPPVPGPGLDALRATGDAPAVLRWLVGTLQAAAGTTCVAAAMRPARPSSAATTMVAARATAATPLGQTRAQGRTAARRAAYSSPTAARTAAAPTSTGLRTASIVRRGPVAGAEKWSWENMVVSLWQSRPAREGAKRPNDPGRRPQRPAAGTAQAWGKPR